MKTLALVKTVLLLSLLLLTSSFTPIHAESRILTDHERLRAQSESLSKLKAGTPLSLKIEALILSEALSEVAISPPDLPQGLTPEQIQRIESKGRALVMQLDRTDHLDGHLALEIEKLACLAGVARRPQIIELKVQSLKIARARLHR